MAWRNFRDPEYIKWRKAVYIRDNYQCQYPGCVSKKGLEAHHIIPWSRSSSLRFVIDNGLTLCKEHHTLVTGHEGDFVELFTSIIAQGKNHSLDPFAVDRLLAEQKKRNNKNGK